ncbi:hypothetical protein ACWGH8_39910 [Nonomuraea muscovyensis]|uniref:Uncharacterized protein n=1 Tax=Nonomuraea muscovyensis TaxID=1124761 RepID=A0A7X0C3W6_9ACTN|nr:hypothetical protein [Nonomuraea muscovyensis]MBB6347708.1 hypothetical protein [Nonomuraea muscovyensis]
MQTVIADAAARGEVDLDLVDVDSTTARAHHHAAGMVMDGELMTALEKAADEERGLHQRGEGLHLRGAILWIRSLRSR